MAEGWPKKRRLLGTKITRLDGPDKATGRAKYSYDINRPGMLHGAILRSPHAHAKIKSLDTTAAKKTPGFKAIVVIGASRDWLVVKADAAGSTLDVKSIPNKKKKEKEEERTIKVTPGVTLISKNKVVKLADLKPDDPVTVEVQDEAVGRELFFAGDEILAIAADTEEHAKDILHAIKIEFDPLDHIVSEEEVLKNPKKKTTPGPVQGNLEVGKEATKGDVDAAFPKADATVEGTYGVPVISHQCLETHGLVAEWDADGGLTVWASTQATVAVAGSLAARFGVPPTKVKCVTHYMGGGFGSKFSPGAYGFAAADLARARCPGQDHARPRGGDHDRGQPPQRLRHREDRRQQGRHHHRVLGRLPRHPRLHGRGHGEPGPPAVHLPRHDRELEAQPLGRVHQRGQVRGHARPWPPAELRPHRVRGGRPRGQARHRPAHHAPQEPPSQQPEGHRQGRVGGAAQRRLQRAVRHRRQTLRLEGEVARAGQRQGRDREARHRHGRPHLGRLRGRRQHAQRLHCHHRPRRLRHGPTSTQDLGTAQRTVTAIVTAEVLGLGVADITVMIGESQYGFSTGSGGSTTCPAQAPATLLAAQAARDDLFKKVAAKVGADPKDLTVEPGKVVDAKNKKEWAWKEFCARLGMDEAKGKGEWSLAISNEAGNENISSGQVGGVQTAEVLVDSETGVVRVTHMVAVQDCGLVVNKLACESQVAGGVIMGLNYAVYEENILDRVTGRQVNPDMEFYKLGGLRDMPKITVHMMDMPDRGVIGIGEPPTISTAAAIGNAVFNALGVRVPFLPLSPRRVLDAIAKGGKAK